MIDNNYITVKEYADRNNITIYEVFSLSADGKLKTKVIDGISYVYVDNCNIDSNSSDIDYIAYISTLQDRIATLEKQLSDKEKIIEEFANKFADIAIQSQQITTQTQLLQVVNTEKQGFFKRLLHRIK